MNAVIDRFGLLLDIIDEMRRDLRVANVEIEDCNEIISDLNDDLKRANEVAEKERAITDAVTDSYSLLESENNRFRKALERIAGFGTDPNGDPSYNGVKVDLPSIASNALDYTDD